MKIIVTGKLKSSSELLQGLFKGLEILFVEVEKTYRLLSIPLSFYLFSKL